MEWFTGLVLVGAALGLTQIVRASATAPRDPTVLQPVRALAIISIALVEGIAVLAVVAALLGIFVRDIGTDGSAAVVGGLGVVGGTFGLIGILPAFRASNPEQRSLAIIGAAFIGGLATLGVVVALQMVLVGGGEPSPLAPAIYAALGLAGLGLTSLMGLAGARGIEAILAGGSVTEARATTLRRLVVLELPALLVAIGVIVTALPPS
jgi:F0F1-type ATP synthase membrane subunit c/vacuolar-type H+-ATPase subunit K